MEDSAVTPYVTPGNAYLNFPETDAMKWPAHRRQKTVAIIDDERDIADLYCMLCTSKGLRVSFIAHDGAEALEIFKRAVCPDVILIDHRMPTMSGLEAMKRMLEIRPGAKFIVLSADEYVHADALKAGARAFLKKPASIHDIHGIIIKVLDMP